jgi:cohesin loading factor subunit SCC2
MFEFEQDTGLGVRRRVVKLLKSLYPVVNDEGVQVEICRKLIWRVFDEDDGIKVQSMVYS